MTTATVDPSPAPVASTRSPLSLWPYVVLLAVIGAAGYSFYRLCEPPAGPPSEYAAIAYSPSTGAFGSAVNSSTLEEAEKEALARCSHPDAKVVVWSHGAFCALATAEDKSFGTGSGKTVAEAEKAALEHCRSRTNAECRVAVCLSPMGGVGEPGPGDATGTYAALAYSRSTGEYGAAHDCATLAQAERMAKRLCQAGDAEVLTWVRGPKWCALAVAEDRAYGYGWAATRAEAEKNALYQCSRYARTPYKLVAAVNGSPNRLEESFVVHPGTGPAHNITLDRFPAAGGKLTVNRDEQSFFSFEATTANAGEALSNEEDVVTKQVTVTNLEGDANRPTKYLAFFAKATKNKDGKPAAESIQGRSVTYTWNGSKYDLAIDGPVTDKDRKLLEEGANLQHLETILAPGRPVKAGETWSISAAELAKGSGQLRLDEGGTRVVCRLVRVYEKGGRPRGVFQLTGDLSVAEAGPATFDPPVHGTLDGVLDAVIDGSSPDSVFTQSSEIRGFTNIIAGDRRRWAGLQMTYKSREERKPTE